MTQFDSLKLCRCLRWWKLSHFKTNVPYVKPISMLVLKLLKVRHPCIANIQTCCILLSFTAFGFKMWSCWYMHALQWPQGGDLCWLQKDFQSQKSMGQPPALTSVHTLLLTSQALGSGSIYLYVVKSIWFCQSYINRRYFILYSVFLFFSKWLSGCCLHNLNQLDKTNTFKSPQKHLCASCLTGALP